MKTYQEARKHSEYSRIPEHILADLYAYVEHRQSVGHFLSAVLCGNLFEAVGRADKESCAVLREIVMFIHNEMRSDCYGNPAKVREWLHPTPPHSHD